MKRMRKSSSTRTGPKILRRSFLLNTLKAAASVLNSVHASAINIKELCEIIYETWSGIDLKYCENLVESVPYRIKKVIRQKGDMQHAYIIGHYNP